MKCCLKKYLAPIRDCLDFSDLNSDAIVAHAASARKHAGKLFDFVAEKTRTFSLLDFAFLKICLLSLGIWLGAQFSRFFRRFRIVIFLGFVISYVYLIWRLFVRED